jgi:hypothetical protein
MLSERLATQLTCGAIIAAGEIVWQLDTWLFP